MLRPGFREDGWDASWSSEIARFTDREDLRSRFREILHSVEQPPVLMFYGIGGAGKSWLLKKLREEAPHDIPCAVLDFAVESGGQRYVLDPSLALQEIRQQVVGEAPRFDMALGTLRYKQGLGSEPNQYPKGIGIAMEVAAEIGKKAVEIVPGAMVPGASVLTSYLSKALWSRLKDMPLAEFLATRLGSEFALRLRAQTAQEIGNKLLYYLADDLSKNLPVHLNRATRAVVYFDSYEALGSGVASNEDQHRREKWIRDLAANFDFGITIIAGQNRLAWTEVDPSWGESTEQHLVGGLAEGDAIEYLKLSGIAAPASISAILRTAREGDRGGYHCFSLHLCAQIVENERRSTGHDPDPQTLVFQPQDWRALAARFLRSLRTDADRRWVERLALTPRFDETAARLAYASDSGVAQDAAWGALRDYSFVNTLTERPGWFSVRSQMRWALENQPDVRGRVAADHQLWRELWQGKSGSPVNEAASLAWYHFFCLKPAEALAEWNQLAVAARTAFPPRMQEHFELLRWWEPVRLLGEVKISPEAALACNDFGVELWRASLGDRAANLQLAIEYYGAALQVRTEDAFPRDWAMTQNNLGMAWGDLPSGDRDANLRQAIGCYEAALRVYIESAFPQDWAMMQNNLGTAWTRLPIGNRNANLQEAIGCYKAALRVFTEGAFAKDWAMTQNNLGVAWSNLQLKDRNTNLQEAINCYRAALRVYTEIAFPQDWAQTQNNLGTAWRNMPNENRSANLLQAINCHQAALRVYTESAFPRAWAMTQNNLGMAWGDLPSGDQNANLLRAIEYYNASLRVYTERAFPQDWAMTQNNLGTAWEDLPSGDLNANLLRAIEYYNASLRVYTEITFPRDWAMMQNNLGTAWGDLQSGDRNANLLRAIEHYSAALRVYTENAFPPDWAMTQNNLGTAWGDLESGDRNANLLQAIEHYNGARRVYTESAFPLDWAMMQNNLGTAWGDLRSGDRNANLLQAIEYYSAALRVYTERAFPPDWAMTQNNLGTAWGDLQSGDRNANLLQAIEHYDAVLRVYTERAFPRDWAMTQHNLGLTWTELSKGDRKANLLQAIEHYNAALRVYTECEFPQEHHRVLRNLQRARQAFERN